MLDVIIDTLLDLLKILPFLFLTYLLMEFIEHKAHDKVEILIKKSGRLGPVAGALLGAFPQCGFSVAGSGLYAGGVITVGTLLSIFLSTSDEMIPIMLGSEVPVLSVLKIVGIKVLIALIFGLLVDLVVSLFKKNKDVCIVDICEEENCHCEEKGIFFSAIHHTFHVMLFLSIVVFALNILIYFIGEDTLSSLFVSYPVVGQFVSGIIGLIPNCAASVVITNMYLSNMISFGSMLTGLLVSAGVGVLVLFRTNHHIKDNLIILGLLYFLGVVSGVIIDLIGITIIL